MNYIVDPMKGEYLIGNPFDGYSKYYFELSFLSVDHLINTFSFSAALALFE